MCKYIETKINLSNMESELIELKELEEKREILILEKTNPRYVDVIDEQIYALKLKIKIN